MINAEVVAILGVGAMLLAAIVPAILYLASLIDKQGQSLNQRIDETNKIIIELGRDINLRFDETNKRIDEQINQLAAFREDMAGRMGRVEGMLEGLYDRSIKERAA